MTEKKTTSTTFQELHPDVADLVKQLVREVDKLVAGVETLDANNWLKSADKIDSLNEQLKNIVLEPETSDAE